MYLNCHTYYSLRYGTISIEELVERAISLGVRRLALTDINNTSAVFDFVALCQKREIEPVVGVEFRNGNDFMYVCLARNEEGFSEINAFMTEHNISEKDYPLKAPAFKNVFTIYPLHVYEAGFSFSENEFVGVRLNEVNRLIRFRNSDFGTPKSEIVSPKSFVLLQPVTFLNRTGFNLHRLLRSIDENCLLSKLPKTSQCFEDELFHEQAYLEQALVNYPHIIENTERLLSFCSFKFDFDTPKNKTVFSSSKEADLELLTKLAWDGFRYRYGKKNDEAKARIEKELKIIYELGFGSYFLITWDIIRYARSRGYFHVGRGSGANSIVAYCLQITDVDPIELDLYFERFINPFRTSPPDFDIDFSWDERDEIIDYVFKRYGKEYVCLLATYVTFKDRSAYRELGKVFGLPKSEIDAMVGGRTWAYENVERGGGNVLKAEYGVSGMGNQVSGMSNQVSGMSNQVSGMGNQVSGMSNQLASRDAMHSVSTNNLIVPRTVVGESISHGLGDAMHGVSTKTAANQKPKTKNLIPDTSYPIPHTSSLIYKYGKLMEDFPNYLSIHAGGIMISEKPLSYYTALVPMPKGFPICQFDMYVAEDVGFAKFDVLSQRGLGHIKEAVDIIWKNRQINVDAHAIQKFKDDPLIKKQIQRHETMGCFYIESPAMRSLIWKLRCDNYLTLVAASSIIRPGVASSGMMQAYIQRHHDPSKVEYIHPKMKDLLEETYGVMVYQEDVIKVAHHFAGLTLAEADVLRRAMSGKYRSRIEFQKIVDKWFANCKERGYPDDIAKEVWRQIESFSGYSFSKAHSASFAVESYQSLYLKTHYPKEFMVAVINNFGGFYKTEFYIHEARRCGAIIEPPEINNSSYLTHIEGDTIWLGWVHVKGLERKLADWLIGEAEARPFRSFDDFCRRVPAGLEQLMILIRVGAFRNLGIGKKELLWEAHMKFNSRANFVSNGDLFELPEQHYEFPKLVHDALEDAYDELELLGFTTGIHPFNMVINKPVAGVHALNMVSGMSSQVSGISNQVSGISSQVSGMSNQVSGMSSQVSDIGCELKPHTSSLTPHTPHTSNLIPATSNLIPYKPITNKQQQVTMLGYMVTLKPTHTKKGDRMVFGYFLDEFGEFFDTVHFPKSAAQYPFSGWGIYHLKGIITEEFGHCALQVTWMEKLGLMGDPRGE
jgi:DNA polymerase III alpha subunit